MPFQLNQEKGEFLIRLARKALTKYLQTNKCISVPEETPKKLLECCGVFITINSVEKGKKDLRGCIGFPYPTNPLAEAVIQASISSGTQDPRFDSISLDELSNVIFEVSVLTPPEKISVSKAKDYIKSVMVGQDGLIIERGMCKGLLLPQVPVEWQWNEEEFLCQCCIKAGLPPDSWLIEGTKVYKFQAIIFEEEEPNGNIKRLSIDRK